MALYSSVPPFIMFMLEPMILPGDNYFTHKLAKIVYNMLKYGKRYVDVGAEYYENEYHQRVLKNLSRGAAQFKMSLVPVQE